MLTYEEARPWAGTMKLAVRQKIMHGMPIPKLAFSDDRSLTQEEINTIVAWATAGAPIGDPKDNATSSKFWWRVGVFRSRM
jgi:hypothetical protein